MRTRAKAARPSAARPKSSGISISALSHPEPAASTANGLLALSASSTTERTALAGVERATAPLPHLERIQAAFGPYDIRHVRAQVGGDAGAAAEAIGSRAFAIGTRVAFRSEPDLHLAAHEAAHVVQQRIGVARDDGANHAGDTHEQHANAVADAVVAGRSAEPLLSQAAPSTGVQRATDEDRAALASTPGGMRVGELDELTVQDTFDKVLPLVSQTTLYELERLYELSQGRSLAANERLYGSDVERRIRTTSSTLDSGSFAPVLRQDTKAAYFHDVAVVFARAFRDAHLDVAAITETVGAVSVTYEQLVQLYTSDRLSIPRPLAKDAVEFENDFTARADLLLRFAKVQLGSAPASLDRVKQGMAADVSRLAAADFQSYAVRILAPDRAAEWLVYEMLGEPPALPELRNVFGQVARQVNLKPQVARLVYLVTDQYFEDLIGKPVAATLAAAQDKPKRERARRELALPIGRYLARVGGKVAYDTTAWFISTMTSSHGAVIPKEVEDQLSLASAEELAPAAPAIPAAAPPPPVAAPHTCRATYSISDVEAYFDARIGVKKDARKHDVKFAPELVLCQFRGMHSAALLAATGAHLAEWLAAADRSAADLRKAIEDALIRDREIGKRRMTVARSKLKDQPELPDLVKELRFGVGYFYELYQVPYEQEPAIDELEKQFDDLSFPYFFALRRYQETLLTALQIVIDAEKTQLDVYLRDRYPESHALTFADLRDHVLVGERWPHVGDPALRDSEGFAIQLEELKLALQQASDDRAAEHRAEIEEEVYRKIDASVRRVRRDHKDEDRVTVDEVWDDLKDWMSGVVKPGEEGMAKEIVGVALGDVHAARYAELEAKAEKAIVVERDPKTAARLVERMKALKSALDQPVSGANEAALLDMVRGESVNIIGLWTMVETSWVTGEGPMRLDSAGGVIRAANLLRFPLSEGHATTLGDAYEWIEHNQAEILAIAAGGGDKLKAMLEGSDKGMSDWFELKFGPLFSSINTAVAGAIQVLERSKQSRALKYLIDAENAGSGEKRKDAIAELAHVMGKKSASHSKAVAQFVYAYLLDATEELQDAADTAKQQLAAAKDAQHKIDERMAYDKAHPGEPKSTTKKKEEAAWVAAVNKVTTARFHGAPKAIAKAGVPGSLPVDPAALQLEAEASEARGKIVAAFENGWHPIKNRALTKKEQHWWSEYDRLGGLAEKGWAELKEFGEGVLVAFAVGLVTGGLGDLAIGGLEIASSDAMIGWGLQVGDVATAGIKLGEMAAFTESMRIIQDLQTGQGPESSFWEDLGVNVVMAGASKFAAGRMSKALESRNIKLTSLRARASMFVAEYIATSGVGLAHLYISSAFRGDTVTESDVKANLLSNFAFLVGMKATHAFVELPKQVFGEEARTWKDPAVAAKYKELASVVEKYDEEFRKVLPEILKAETPEQRRELLEHQADILEGKAKRIEESGIPDAAEVAKSFRAGVEAFKADAKRATTLEQIKVKGVGDTPNLSYERGSLNEAALESMLRDSESNFKIIEKANGAKVYVVMTAEGAIRYEPREPGTGGSQKEAYSKASRIKGEEIPGKTKGSKEKIESAKDVALILAAATSTRSKLIPSSVGESFELKGTECRVSLAVADKLSSSADHDAGPATYSLRLNASGEWEATVTVRKSAPNDHVVRGVNHEVTELNELIQRLEARAKTLPGGRDAYKKPAVLAKALAAETSERALKDPKKGELSSHDLANLDADVATVEKQIAEAQAALERLQPGQDRSAAEARKEMLENDVGAMMNLLDLPPNEKQLEARISELEKQGASAAALRSLRQLHVARSTKFEFGMADLQIIFAQLKGANPDLVTEGSFLGMKLYFEEKVRGRVEEVVKAERKKGSTEQEVRDAALVEAKKMLGGTSIASWRGRAFEGLLVDTFNNNPQLVATYGRMYQITQNNFPTYDIVGVKFSTGAGGVSAKNVATPLKFTLETVKANGKEIRVLVVLDANGKELVRQRPDGTITKHPHVEVWLSSLKAKDNAVITEMTKALGTPEKPTGQFMDVTPEYMESIDDKLDNARDRAKRAKASGDKSALKDANKRISLLEFFKTKIRVNDDLTNARIDSLLQMLKSQGIDTNQIADDAVKKIKKKKGP